MFNLDTIKLGQIASARSGDKGNHANIGIVAYTQAGYEFLAEHLTCERLTEVFSQLGATRIEVYPLPKVWALNIVLYNALEGGASTSLRIDSQGKLLGTAMEQFQLPKPDNLDQMLQPTE